MEDVSEPSALPRSADVVAGRYVIEDVLGEGTYGRVFRARHVELGSRVAIKVLKAFAAEAVTRFRREAQLLARLNGPHVARVFDSGTLGNGAPFFVMELLEGRDLA